MRMISERENDAAPIQNEDIILEKSEEEKNDVNDFNEKEVNEEQDVSDEKNAESEVDTSEKQEVNEEQDVSDKQIAESEVDTSEKQEDTEDQQPVDTAEEIKRIRNEINDLETQKSEAETNIKNLSKEMDKIKEDRDNFNKESALAFKKVNELKDKRDDTNKEIGELKTMREGVLVELKNEIENARNLRQQLNDEGKHINPQKMSQLNETVKKLEWRLQTTPNMPIEDERILSSQVDDLLVELDDLKLSESKIGEMRKLNRDIAKLKGFLDDSWKQFNDLVNVSQTRHQRMIELYEEGKVAKDKADNLHQSFLTKATEYRKHRKVLTEARTKLRKYYPQLRKYQKEKKQVMIRERKEKNADFLQGRAAEIKEKFKKGKVALSMEEMRVVMDSELLDLKNKKKR